MLVETRVHSWTYNDKRCPYVFKMYYTSCDAID
jgi:hypothetical protein